MNRNFCSSDSDTEEEVDPITNSRRSQCVASKYHPTSRTPGISPKQREELRLEEEKAAAEGQAIKERGERARLERLKNPGVMLVGS